MANAEDFILRLQQQVSGPAGVANASLLKLEAQILKEQAALGGLEEKLAAARNGLESLPKSTPFDQVAKAIANVQKAQVDFDAKQSGIGALEGARGLASQVDAAKAAERAKKQQAADEKKLVAEAKRSAAERKAAEREAHAETVKSLGPLGNLYERLSTNAGQAGLAMGAMLSLASALAAVAAAAVAAAVALTSYALAAANAARSSRLFNDAAAGSAKGGEELTMVINDIATRVSLAKEKIADFGRQLELAGLRGRRMQVALEMIAAIESVIPGAGSKLQALAEQFQKVKRAVLTKQDLQGTGLALEDVAAQLAKTMTVSIAAAKTMLQNGTASVDKVLDAMNKAVQKKFGATLAAQLLDLNVLWAKLKENIAGLFSGINLEKFLGSIKEITDLFSQTTVTGKALRVLFTQIFNALFDGASKTGPFVSTVIRGLVLSALRFAIAMKPIAGMIKSLGPGELLTIANAMKLVATAAILFLGIFGPIIEGAVKMLAIFGLISKGLESLGAVFDGTSKTSAAAGQNLVMSFIDSILSNIGAVIAAVSAMGSAAASALLASLGIASPSKVAKGAAVNVTSTFADTVEDGSGDTEKAFDKMVTPKAVKATAKRAKGQGGPGKVVYIENLVLGSREAWGEFREFLRGEFEVETLGGEEAPA